MYIMNHCHSLTKNKTPCLIPTGGRHLCHIHQSYRQNSKYLMNGGNSTPIKVLVGPNYISYWVIDGHQILLLGESHTTAFQNPDQFGYHFKPNELTRVDVWLHDLSVNAKQCLDIMLESPYISDVSQNDPVFSSNPQDLTPLQLTRKIFAECLTTHKTSMTCAGDYTRVHLLDIRKRNHENILIDFYFMSLAWIVPQQYLNKIEERYMEHYELLLKYLLGLDSRKEVELLMKQFVVDAEQYVRCGNDLWKTKNTILHSEKLESEDEIYQLKEKDRQRINDLLDSASSKHLQNFQWLSPTQLLTHWEQFDAIYHWTESFSYYQSLINKEFAKNPKLDRQRVLQTLLQIYSQKNHKINELIISMMNIPQDLYTILRMFIEYQPSKRTPKGCQSLTNEKIIFFGGNNHCQLLEKFFRLYWHDLKPIFHHYDPNNDANFIIFKNIYDYWSFNETQPIDLIEKVGHLLF